MTKPTTTLLLDRQLDLGNARALADRLGAALAENAPIVLDGSEVQHIDGAGLQLLLALRQTAHQEGLSLDWRKPSARLREAAALLGLTGPLGLGEKTT